MEWLTDVINWLNTLISDNTAAVFSYVTLVIRLILPIFAVVIIWRLTRSLLREKYEYEEWGYLSLPNGAKIPLNHWENVIGRSILSDVAMQYPTLSRSHAAVIRDNKGRWRLYDLGSKSGVVLNGSRIEGDEPVNNGDVIILGGVELIFVTIGRVGQAKQARERTRPGESVKPQTTLVYLTAFQVALGLQLCIAQDQTLIPAVPLSFLALIALMWLTYIVTRMLRRVAFEVETLAFFLCTLGLAVTATTDPETLLRQITLLMAGIVLYFVLGWFLRDLTRAVKLRWPIAITGLVLLAVTLLTAESIFGAKNWLSISGVSFQPSEFVKIAFVFAGTATLDRLFARRNLMLFIAFSGLCVMVLALMGDFGTALIFFAAYLTISFLRSGDFATVFLSVAGAGLAGFMAITLKPHVAERFATWGHAWENAYSSGFQQTRAMAAAASGGLFGVGAGNGWLKNIVAADTDMVFGILSEELGLIIAVSAVFALLVFAFYAVRASSTARSSYYVIGACAAVMIMLTQMLLNVFGSVDILPFTGVTFPFVSTGGSSLIACWGLLAFIKAVDNRQNASFAIKAPKRVKRRELDAFDDEEFDDVYD